MSYNNKSLERVKGDMEDLPFSLNFQIFLPARFNCKNFFFSFLTFDVTNLQRYKFGLIDLALIVVFIRLNKQKLWTNEYVQSVIKIYFIISQKQINIKKYNGEFVCMSLFAWNFLCRVEFFSKLQLSCIEEKSR